MKELYAENLKKNIGMEIIYVSADTTEEMYEQGIADQGPWCAIPFEDDISVELRYRYDVTSMPQLVVVKKDGTIISAKGKRELESLGNNVLVTWTDYIQK
ncbi:nucleoredoxin-like protein 2 [Diabrotica virgifera virgifera]|uniref:protein-disulfide reductase n=1 Tax=Diabrotica virgifera virgifera TaxID=50390 RepID=A0ABM5JZL3_DIAVI|nr:nucleoredoxin-like protein 2 [Diabrotica virgifera virgifera]